jgi:hypothetical protein
MIVGKNARGAGATVRLPGVELFALTQSFRAKPQLLRDFLKPTPIPVPIDQLDSTSCMLMAQFQYQ